MKILAILTLIIAFPFSVLAAPLTNSQATSLIGVVQSSPETPASAFTDLITAFSNITVKQAESLITVVQSAPGVDPDAFVSMLIAFTEDTQADKVTELTERVVEVEKTVETIVSEPQVGGIIEPMKEIEVDITRQEYQAPNEPVQYTSDTFPKGQYYFALKVIEDGKTVKEAGTMKITYPENHDFESPWNNTNATPPFDIQTEFYSPGTHGTTFRFGPYIPTSNGTHTVKFEFGDLVKEVEVVVE